MTRAGAPETLIIPAAGLGTRMRSVDRNLPKELLPLANRKVIDYAVNEGLDAGIRKIIVIISEQKESIREHIESTYGGSTSIEISFCYQKEQLGESDAISYASAHAGSGSVAVIYPDNVHLPAPGALKALVPVAAEYGKDVVALSEVTEAVSETISNAGRVDLASLQQGLYRIDAFIPKTSGHFVLRSESELRACGISISGPYLFDYIERTRSTVPEGEFTDLPVREAILADLGVMGCTVPGTVYDVGNPKGYELCLSRIAEQEKQTP